MTEAFVRLYDEHVSDVYGYLVYRHGSRDVAERLTRVTFERAYRAGAEIRRDPRGPRIALLAIARDAASGASNAQTATGDDVIPAELGRALDRLDRGERAVLALRFGAGLRGAEIGAVLELSDRRVRELLSRGLRRVRTELGD